MDRIYIVKVEDFSTTESNDADVHTFKVGGACQTREQAQILLEREANNYKDLVDDEWTIEEDTPDSFHIMDEEFGDFVKVSIIEVPFYHE